MPTAVEVMMAMKIKDLGEKEWKAFAKTARSKSSDSSARIKVSHSRSLFVDLLFKASPSMIRDNTLHLNQPKKFVLLLANQRNKPLRFSIPKSTEITPRYFFSVNIHEGELDKVRKIRYFFRSFVNKLT